MLRVCRTLLIVAVAMCIGTKGFCDSFCEYETTNASTSEAESNRIKLAAVLRIESVPKTKSGVTIIWVSAKVVWIIDYSYEYRRESRLAPYEFGYLKDRAKAFATGDALVFSALVDSNSATQSDNSMMIGLPLYESLTATPNVCGYRPVVTRPGYYYAELGPYLSPRSFYRIGNHSSLLWLFGESD